MEYVIYFILTFIITYIISYFLMIRKSKTKDRNNDTGKIPIEVQYLIKRYNIDLKNINYYKFVRNICLVGSLDMSIVLCIVIKIKGLLLQLFIAFLVLIPLILISYRILGRIYVKKGKIENEHKRNRK